jgi:hypothetical protein
MGTSKGGSKQDEAIITLRSISHMTILGLKLIDFAIGFVAGVVLGPVITLLIQKIKDSIG